MEKIDLRELGRMAKTFRACHRALKKLRDGENFFISFYGSYHRNGEGVPIVDEAAMRACVMESLESELHDLRKRFSAMGIDPIDLDGRKKKRVEVKAVK